MGSPSCGTSQGTVKKTQKGIGGPLKLSREQHFTVVLLANAYPNACVSCSPILKLPPSYTTCLLLLIKSLTSCTSRDINLPGHRSLRILPHTAPPASRKQLKRPMLRPNSWSSAPTLIIIKEKMGEWQNNNVTIYKLEAILSSDLTWETSKDIPTLNRNSHALRQPHPYQRVPPMH
jgi:hypothetical protein